MPKVTEEHKTEVREKIIHAAVENFTKYGFDRARMDDIAQTCGLSKGTLYLYFKNKEDLFYAICEYHTDVLKQQLSTLFRRKEDLLSDAEQFYSNFRKITHDTEVVLFEIIAEASRNKKLRNVLYETKMKTYQAVMAVIEFQIKNGVFRKGTDAKALAMGLVALYDGLILGRLIGVSDAQNKKAWNETIRAIIASMS